MIVRRLKNVFQMHHLFLQNCRSYRRFLKNLVTKISIKVNLDSYYGKNSDAWKKVFSEITGKLYEIYYDANLK